jgi:hypothetical protein
LEETEIINRLSDLKHRVFPRSFERLAVSGKDLIGVAIGIYKGEHAESLLTHLDIKQLYLIDPYELYDEYEEGKAHYGVELDPLHLAREEAIERLARHRDKVTWLFEKSSGCTGDIPDELDFVYIDGNHDEVFVSQDILGYFPKVRLGGVIGGHDFYNGFTREHDGVVRAVTEFSIHNNLTLQVELPDWWIQK